MLPLQKLVQNPRFYDCVQQLAGGSHCRRWLAPSLAELTSGSLLDVGAGTGSFSDLIPVGTRYVAVDLDEGKLGLLREKFPGIEAVVGDATALPFPDASFDYTICLAVAHHLADIDALLSELARVTRTRVLLWDAVWSRRLTGRMLWAIDRGDRPRTSEQISEAFSRHFDLARSSEFALLHRYLLLEGTPKER